MSDLFNILDGFISNVGDFTRDRAEIESRLNDLDEVAAYAEACDVAIDAADAVRIRDVGLAWVANVNDGNGDWLRYRDEARDALSCSPSGLDYTPDKQIMAGDYVRKDGCWKEVLRVNGSEVFTEDGGVIDEHELHRCDIRLPSEV